MGASTIVLIVIVLIVVALIVVGALLMSRQRRGSAASTESTPPAIPEPPPMTGLESALSQVTDRSGRPMKEHIDAEAAHVDDLRVPDDTGPLLRRALDHVSHADEAKQQTAPTPTGDADDGGQAEPG